MGQSPESRVRLSGHPHPPAPAARANDPTPEHAAGVGCSEGWCGYPYPPNASFLHSRDGLASPSCTYRSKPS